MTRSETPVIPGLPERYVLRRRIGSGGMGEVFEATDTVYDRSVAIKLMSGKRWSARFAREVTAVARLSHPNILPLFDSGMAGERPFYVMPFVDGPSLREMLDAGGPLPVERALKVLDQVGAALAYAHANGVIHRDVKPGNILFSGNTALLADFGLVSAQELGPPLTDPGVGVGTPEYASPEQITGSLPAAPETDIYAVGCVGYEMLAGEPPFTGQSVQVILARKVGGEAPRLRTLRPDVPRKLDEAIARTMAPAPTDRFPDIESFLAACEATSSTLPIRRRVMLGGAALGLMVLFSSIAILWPRQPPAVLTVDVSTMAEGAPPAHAERARVLAERTRRQLSLLRGARVFEERPAGPDQPDVTPDVLLRIGISGRGDQASSFRATALDAGADTIIWEGDYSVPAASVLDLQLPSIIAQEVAASLDLRLTREELVEVQRVPTTNAEAWRLFQVARNLYRRSDRPADNLEAAQMFLQAGTIDTTFAEAFAEAADAFAAAYPAGGDTVLIKANSLVERALSLQPTLPEAHLAAAMIHYVQGRFEQARLPVQNALEARPSYFDAGWLKAVILRRQGRWDESLAAFEDLVAFNPGDRVAMLGLGRTLMWLGRYEEALAAFDRAIALGPGARDAPYLDKAWALALSGDSLPAVQRVIDEAEFVAGRSQTLDLLTEQHPVRGWFWWLEGKWGESLETSRDRLTLSSLGEWFLAFSSVLRRRGNIRDSRIYADSAGVELEALVEQRRNDAALRGLLGIAHVLAERPAEGIRWATLGAAMRPVEDDAYSGPESLFLLAQVLALAGEQHRARIYVDSLTRIPSPYSTELFTRFPVWDAASVELPIGSTGSPKAGRGF